MSVSDQSYKQPVKEQARELLWQHAISALTTKRETSGVIARHWLDPIWSQAVERLSQFDIVVDDAVYQNFLRSCSTYYGSREPRDLKVAYFCGPEPENDLGTLTRLGVEIENVWAIEGDRKASKKAIEQARDAFPNLKIFSGSAESFFELIPERFDIIYLDFTGHFWSKETRPFKAVHAVALRQSLAQLGVLVTNFTNPESSREQAEFLAGYLYPMSIVEKSAMGRMFEQDDAEERDWTWSDGPLANGLELEEYTELVKTNTDGAYSAFLSSYVPMFAVDVAPWIRLLNTQSAKKLFFSHDEKLHSERHEALWNNPMGEEEQGSLGDAVVDPQFYAFSAFLRNIRNSKVAASFSGEMRDINAVKACIVRDLLVNAYEGHWDAMSPEMAEGIKRVSNSIFGRMGLFCDAALPNLWIQFAAYQLGYPWHVNATAGARFEYTAKTRSMFVDVHVLDQARPLYDLFGLFDLLGDGVRDLARQLILRCAIDSVHKHQGGSQEQVYFGGNVVGYGATAHEQCRPPRVKIGLGSADE